MSDAVCCFPYGDREVRHLKRADATLGDWIDRTGPVRRALQPDLFHGLIRAILAQQISGKAAETLWRRLEDATGGVRPDRVLSLPEEQLRGCGLSARKAGYVRRIAREVADRTLDLASLRTLPDAEVTRRLVALPGIGPWTADMLLLFSLARPDVLSLLDLGIRRGLMRLYGMAEPDPDFFADRKAAFSPYGSTASLYLWDLSARPDPGRTTE